MANETSSFSDRYNSFGSLGLFGGGSESGTGALDDIEKLLEASRIDEVTFDFYRSYIWVVLAIGLPANVVIIITIIRMKVLSPATVFVTLLAFCDGMALIAKVIGHQLVIYKVNQGKVLCKMEFIPNFFSTEANWVLVLICAERFISVCYPLKKNYLLTKRRCFMVAGAMSALLLSLFTIIFVIMRDDTKYSHLCTTSRKYFTFWETWWMWISTSLYLFIPFLFITAFTIPIIRGLVMSRKHRRSMVLKKSETGKYNAADLHLLKETERTEKMITIMLIVAAIVFLVLCSPACIYYLMYKESSDVLVEAKFKLFKQVAYLFSDCSHAVNFFLYFFTAKRFRSFAFKTFCPCCYSRGMFPKFCGSKKKDDENQSASSRATASTKVP